MKKTLILSNLLIGLLACTYNTAQAQIDTISLDSYLHGCSAADSAGYYSYGYVLGNNSWGDLEKARKFTNSTALNITGVMAKFEGDHMVDDGGNVYFKIYSPDPETGAPSNILGQTYNFPIADIAPDSLIYIEIDNPVYTNEHFFISYVIPNYGANEAGLYYVNGEWEGVACGFEGTEHWELWSNNEWKNMEDTWATFSPDTLAVALFPVVNYPIGIDEGYSSEIALSPNPSSAEVSFYSNTELLEVDEVLLYDLSGKLVMKHENCQKISIENLSSGVYFVKIKQEEGQLYIRRKLVKE